MATFSKGQSENEKPGQASRARRQDGSLARDAVDTGVHLFVSPPGVSALQRLAGNRATNRHLTGLPVSSGPAVALLQRIVTMKDVNQDHERTDGTQEQLDGQVNATIEGNDYKDLNATIKQMRKSIASRKLLAVKNAKSWEPKKKESEAYRLNLEVDYLARLEAARDGHDEHAAVLEAQEAKKAAAAEKKKPNSKGWAVVGNK